MDEIDLLSRLRDDVRAPDPTVLANARKLLLARTLEPPRTGARPWLLGGGTRRLPEAQRGTSRRTPRSLAAVAVVVALAILVSVGFLLNDSGVAGSTGASAQAATLLEQAAVNSVAASDPAVGPRQYRKITTRAVWSSSAEAAGRPVTWLDEEVIEVWIPADPSREWVQRRSGRTPVQFFDPGDEAVVRDGGLAPDPGAPELLRAADGAFYGPVTGSWQTPTADFLASLPRDPRLLLDRIYADSEGQGRSKDGEALVFVADVLRGGTVPADLRAALFRAATMIPGIDVVDERANLSGRVGVAIGRDAEDGDRQEIVFAPETGEFIGDREVVLSDDVVPGVPAGAAIAYTAVSTEVVNQAP